MASEKTEHAIALVGGFPDHAVQLLVREASDATLKQTVDSLCRQYNISIHKILSEAKEHGLPLNAQQTPNTAPASPPNSLGSAGLDFPTRRAPHRSSLSGQSGTSSHHETGPSPELITAVIARIGGQEEHTLTMKRSRISSDFSLITKKKAAELKLYATTCDIPLPTPWPRADGHVLRATHKCKLTWLRSTSEKTHSTPCLIVPSSYLEADLELGR